MTIGTYLRNCRELAALCGRNGLVDGDTLRFHVESECLSPRSVIAEIHFEEVITEESGWVAGRYDRWGKVRLDLDDRGEVRSLHLL